MCGRLTRASATAGAPPGAGAPVPAAGSRAGASAARARRHGPRRWRAGHRAAPVRASRRSTAQGARHRVWRSGMVWAGDHACFQEPGRLKAGQLDSPDRLGKPSTRPKGGVRSPTSCECRASLHTRPLRSSSGSHPDMEGPPTLLLSIRGSRGPPWAGTGAVRRLTGPKLPWTRHRRIPGRALRRRPTRRCGPYPRHRRLTCPSLERQCSMTPRGLALRYSHGSFHGEGSRA